jgi:hypothetical protein
MLETKEQKQIFAGSLVLIVILGVVSFWHRPGFQYTDTTNYQALKKASDQKQRVYAEYLASVGTTPEAQAQLYSEILPPAEIQAAVEQELNTSQAIVFPSKPNAAMRVAAVSGKTPVIKYFNATNPIVGKVRKATEAAKNDLFNVNGSAAQIDSLIVNLNSSLSQLAEIPVPKETADFQAQQLMALEAYLDLAKTARSYASAPSQSPWPQMYKDVAIMTKNAGDAEKSFNDLNRKYNLLAYQDPDIQAEEGNFFIPAAHAQIGASLVSMIGNPWQELKDGLKIAAATAVAQFMLNFLNKLAVKIQQAYRISNFLYYTDALVAGQYVDDYLNKYVNDPFDRGMIKNFIPAVSCGKTQNLTPLFQAKADQYLGFDPQSLDPSDPDYYQKLARVGSFLSSPQGWQVYYQDVASQANSAATQAANNELNSQGNKSSRDITGGILTTAQTTVDAMRAAVQNMLASGFAGVSGDPWTAKIVSQITQSFLNSFIFQGTVLKEQKACIAVPMVNLVSPLPLNAFPGN